MGVVDGSEGGLLVGTAITQRRDRFNAAIVQVALFEVFRFTKLAQAPPTSANTAIPPSRAARLDRDLLTLSEACPGQDLPGPVHFSLPTRTTACIRPTAARLRQACCARPAPLLL